MHPPEGMHTAPHRRLVGYMSRASPRFPFFAIASVAQRLTGRVTDSLFPSVAPGHRLVCLCNINLQALHSHFSPIYDLTYDPLRISGYKATMMLRLLALYAAVAGWYVLRAAAIGIILAAVVKGFMTEMPLLVRQTQTDGGPGVRGFYAAVSHICLLILGMIFGWSPTTAPAWRGIDR